MPTSAAYVYDSVSDRWSEFVARLPEARGSGALAFMNDELWFISGLVCILLHLYTHAFTHMRVSTLARGSGALAL